MLSSVTHWKVLNIRLNFLISVQFASFQLFGFFDTYFSIKAFICSKVQLSGTVLSTQNSSFNWFIISSSDLFFLNFSITSSIILSTLNLSPVFLSSTRGSEKFDKCPLASQVFTFIKIAASKGIISDLLWVKVWYQLSNIFFLNIVP